MAIQNSVFTRTEQMLKGTNCSSFKTKTLASIAAGFTSALACTPRELLIIQQQNNGGHFYDIAKKIIQYSSSHPLLNTLAPSMIAGLLSASITYPIDTVKTNMQANLHEHNGIDICKNIYRSKHKPTVRDFYGGITPRMIGVASSMAMEYNLRDFFTRYFTAKR